MNVEAITTFTRTAPSAWASYLINSDRSSLDDSELALVVEFVNQYGFPVSCDDAGFMWTHDASHIMPLGAECQRYLFVTREE